MSSERFLDFLARLQGVPHEGPISYNILVMSEILEMPAGRVETVKVSLRGEDWGLL